MTHAEYHARAEVGHSMLEAFRQSVPLYHATFVAKTLPPRPPTPAMLLGTALHAAVLEPEKYADLVAVMPEIDKRTKAGKAAWLSFEESAAGKAAITRPQAALVAGMRAAVLGHPAAADLLRRLVRKEQPVFWDDESGVTCKCRPDGVAGDGELLDLKTADDPSPRAWARAAATFGYHRQAAHYLAGAGGPAFTFVVVGSAPPHEVAVVRLDSLSLDLGRRQRRAALDELAACLALDEWGSRWPRGQEVTLPAWAFHEE